jgi:hypothetical protein
VSGRHTLRAGADIARSALVAELEARAARATVDPAYSPWDSPVVGRHRVGSPGTVAHPGLVPDWEELVVGVAPPF